MTNKIFKIAALSLTVSMSASCSDWLTPEPEKGYDLDYTDKVMYEKDAQYFENLRAWKATPGLPQTFVWFDSWSGSSNSGSESLRALPDSVTIASNWGAHGADTSKFSLSPARKLDMEITQKDKGTKIVVTFFSRFPGEGLPKSKFPHWYKYDNTKKDWVYIYENNQEYCDMTEEEFIPIIRRYAEDMYKACLEAGYDGWDWDYEPGFGMGSGIGAPFWSYEKQRKAFVEEMSYWFGRYSMDPNRDRGGRPMPEKQLLMIIDGAIGFGSFVDMPAKYFDWFILQAYSGGMAQSLDSRVYNAMNEIKRQAPDEWTEAEIVSKIILTENFESFAGNGGNFLNMSKYVQKYDLSYKPMNQQIGGCGLYRVGMDYRNGKWFFLDQGITNMYRIWRERNQASEENK